MGMKINFCAQDQEEEEEDPKPKGFYKSAERRKSDLSVSFKQIERCHHHPQPHALLFAHRRLLDLEGLENLFFCSLIPPNVSFHSIFFSYEICYLKNPRETSFFEDFSFLGIAHTWMKF